MSVLPVLEAAIRAQAPIRFRYVRDGKTSGVRVGDPHCVYMERLIDGSERVYIDVWQTGGASDSGKPLPSWRRCFLDGITDVEVMSDEAPFDVCDSYNPTYYEYPICKI